MNGDEELSQQEINGAAAAADADADADAGTADAGTAVLKIMSNEKFFKKIMRFL